MGGTKTGYFRAKDEAPKEEVPEEMWDKEASSLVQVKVKETAWDRKKRKMREMADRHPFLSRLWNLTEKVGDKTGTAAADMGDRVFGETDEALTVFEIKERDPEFAMMGFMKEVREV